ncbi:MAG TPA: hypothetical protein VF659_12495 [Pyrinomonadaceae bacterium]|jgi:hypothetical protein
MTVHLHVFNPSHYPRGGFVTTPWQPVFEGAHVPPERVAVFDDKGRQLDTQVHRADPADPSRDTLVFWLDEALPPGYENHREPSAVFAVGEREREASRDELKCVTEGDEGEEHRVTLSNEVLSVQFELAPAPRGDGRDWYAGSATIVMLEQETPGPYIWVKDMLDAFNAVSDHDPEKRCMQVDRVRLSLPASERQPDADFYLANRPYKLLSRSVGPVRSSVCVASAPFEYSYRDPRGGETRRLTCSLRRVISLYRGANFVVDELSVVGTRRGGARAPAGLFFKARYFMQMDLGLMASPCRHFRIWDWFGISSDWEPLKEPLTAFGFATDAHCGPVVQAPADYPDPLKSHKAFSWELERADHALCVHLFSRCDGRGIEQRAGSAWYEYAYRPIWVNPITAPPAGPARGVTDDRL